MSTEKYIYSADSAIMEKSEINSEDELEMPSLISEDPNERKLARKLRLNRRLRALERFVGRENIMIPLLYREHPKPIRDNCNFSSILVFLGIFIS